MYDVCSPQGIWHRSVTYRPRWRRPWKKNKRSRTRYHKLTQMHQNIFEGARNCLLSAQSLCSTVHSGFVDVRAHAVREVQRAGRMWSETWLGLIHDLRVTCVFLFFWQLHSLQSQLEFQEQSMVEKSLVSRQEAKIRELETKLEYERTQSKRLEVSHVTLILHGIHTAFSHFISFWILVVNFNLFLVWFKVFILFHT